MNTHGTKREVFCQADPFHQSFDFWIRETQWSPERIAIAYALPLTFRTNTPEDEGKMMLPAFSLRGEEAQRFIDELWRVGFRPTEGTGSAGALAAVEKHLADMRALVFKKEPKGF